MVEETDKKLEKIYGFMLKISKMMGTVGMNPKELDIFQDIRQIIYEWKHFKELQEQNKLFILPCTVGTTVYSLECGEIEPVEVTSFLIRNEGKDLWCLNSFGGIIGRYGESVFLTEDEAESVLKETSELRVCDLESKREGDLEKNGYSDTKRKKHGKRCY